MSYLADNGCQTTPGNVFSAELNTKCPPPHNIKDPYRIMI